MLRAYLEMPWAMSRLVVLLVLLLVMAAFFGAETLKKR